MYIVVFNGPPYSGKDTLSGFFRDYVEKLHHVPMKEESLSNPLRSIAYAMVGLSYPSKDVSYDSFKAITFNIGGKPVTGRQLMIDASERFLKQCYGQRVMADLLIERNREFGIFDPGLLLIRDGGFQVEVNPLIEWVGRDQVMVVRVERPACDFSQDSREWVYHPDEKMNMTVFNDSDLSNLQTEAGRLYGRLVNQKGWKF